MPPCPSLRDPTGRAYARGEITKEQLAAAWGAAWDAEREWQQQRIDEVVAARGDAEYPEYTEREQS